MAEHSSACAGVDVGGTFTDVVVHAAGHRPRAVKVPTTPDNQAVGVQRGVAQGWPTSGPKNGQGAALRLLPHGTTTAINAVLERKVARTVLVTTDGFADVLQIARQDRPARYDLRVTRPEPLVPHDRVVTVVERAGPDGAVVIALIDEEIDRVVGQVARLEPESVAVSLLFSYAGDEHERRLCDALRRLDVPITRSSSLLRAFGEGLIREVKVLVDCALTVQSERREHPPWGLGGGRSGAVGATSCATLTGPGRSCPARAPGRCAAVTGSASKPPVAAAGGTRHS